MLILTFNYWFLRLLQWLVEWHHKNNKGYYEGVLKL